MSFQHSYIQKIACPFAIGEEVNSSNLALTLVNLGHLSRGSLKSSGIKISCHKETCHLHFYIGTVRMFVIVAREQWQVFGKDGEAFEKRTPFLVNIIFACLLEA